MFAGQWVEVNQEWLFIDQNTAETKVVLWKEPFGGWGWAVVESNIIKFSIESHKKAKKEAEKSLAYKKGR